MQALGVVGILFSYEWAIKGMLKYKKNNIDSMTIQMNIHKASLEKLERFKNDSEDPETRRLAAEAIPDFKNEVALVCVDFKEIPMDEAQKLLEYKEQNFKKWQNFSISYVAGKLFSGKPPAS